MWALGAAVTALPGRDLLASAPDPGDSEDQPSILGPAWGEWPVPEEQGVLRGEWEHGCGTEGPVESSGSMDGAGWAERASLFRFPL